METKQLCTRLMHKFFVIASLHQRIATSSSKAALCLVQALSSAMQSVFSQSDILFQTTITRLGSPSDFSEGFYFKS